MLVEMRINITGYRNGVPWPAPGEAIELPDHEAADLIAVGYAAPLEVPTAPAAVHDPAVDGPILPAVELLAAVPGKAADVIAWIDGNRARAEAARAVERARPKPRATVMTAVDDVLEVSDAPTTVPDAPTGDPGPDAPAADPAGA